MIRKVLNREPHWAAADWYWAIETDDMRLLLTDHEMQAAQYRAERNPEDFEREEPEPEEPPVEEPEPEPEPGDDDSDDPAEWFSGRYALSLDGLPGMLDIDAGTVTLPIFGRVAAAIDELGGRITATFEVPGHGEGTIELTYRDGALSGHATTASQRVPVTGRREADAPEPEPQEPLPPPTGGGGGLDADFHDDFSSGDLSRRQGGFRWTGSRYTDVVSMGGGQHAMRLRYGPREPDGKTHMWAEQRFDHAPTLEQWLEYMMYVPENYRHGFDGGSANNIKLHAAWGPLGYSKPGNGVFQLWTSGALNGSSTANWSRRGPGDAHGLYPRGYEGSRLFIDRARHAGKWIRVRMHLKRSDPGRENGVVELWRDEELVYGFYADRNHGSDSDPSLNPFTGGYLLGYDNPPYFGEDTTFLIRDFRWWSRDPNW